MVLKSINKLWFWGLNLWLGLLSLIPDSLSNYVLDMAHRHLKISCPKPHSWPFPSTCFSHYFSSWLMLTILFQFLKPKPRHYFVFLYFFYTLSLLASPTDFMFKTFLEYNLFYYADYCPSGLSYHYLVSRLLRRLLNWCHYFCSCSSAICSQHGSKNGPVRHKSINVTLLFKTLQCISTSLRVKLMLFLWSLSPYMIWPALCHLLLWPYVPLLSPFFSVIWPHWATCLSLKTSDMILLQCLCTGHSFSLECSSPR